ncbi:hypothetical protein QBC35DRAFT_478741 [Podospora australis]|uniref:Uncharacterized protein n=1 Tax=Podospora australis TaxID=1536484 RepID=A0AAN6WJJ9_9PEZI|nr:hypothetical protein QBC35DRAFT_478741 [Podospora australis]
MKSIISATILLSSLASATPVRREPGPYEITNFFASKTHNSAHQTFDFFVTAPSLPEPVNCHAGLDGGFGGATWLAYVWDGKCDNPAVTWTFNNPMVEYNVANPAIFNVTVDGVRGTYNMPARDITVWLNNEPNPFDNDVAYTGPANFSITQFFGEE